ncbi:hypothetical protein F2O83_23665 [Escherichia coli]|nr:hypothetical protein [Escherichia coli]
MSHTPHTSTILRFCGPVPPLTPPHSGLCIFKQSQSSHILSILKLTSSSVISFRRGMCYTPCKTVIKDINAIVNDYRIPVDSQYWFATKQCSHT